MYYRVEPRYTGITIIRVFLFVNLFIFLISSGKGIMRLINSTEWIGTFYFLANTFAFFINFSFVKQAREIDCDKLNAAIDEKDTNIKLQLEAENLKLKNEISHLNETFELRVQRRIEFLEKQKRMDERLKNQATF